MTTRRTVLLAAAAIAMIAAGPASARAPDKFDPAAFEAAVKSGKPVLVHVETSWCPICKAQRPIVATLLDDPRFADYAAFAIDFDTEKANARLVAAPVQSTLIVFAGGKEVGRSVGEPQEEWIEDLLEKGLPAKPKPAG